MNPEIDISVSPVEACVAEGLTPQTPGFTLARHVVSLDKELFFTFSLFTDPGSRGPFSKYLI